MTNTALVPSMEALAAYAQATPEQRPAVFARSYADMQQFRAEHPEVPFVAELADEWRAAFVAWKAARMAAATPECSCSDSCDGIRGSASCNAGEP